jgi:formylglycine-generating enzyme required for sulfatase activity
VAFCKAVSKKTGNTVRLPTEAQWEYACRAGTTTPFNTGETISTDEANYDRNFEYIDSKTGEHRGKTMPVGGFKPNAWGLYDMHGNVWQWCHDWFGENYYANSPATDPKGPKGGKGRVLRGVGWNYYPVNCRSAYRFSYVPVYHCNCDGFRVVVLSGSK